MKKENTRLIEKLTTYLFYFSIILFFIGFNFRDNPPFGWYQQFLPTPLGGQIKDIYFIDRNDDKCCGILWGKRDIVF